VVLSKGINVFLPFAMILSSCGGGGGVEGVAGDSGGRPNERVCNTVYYQEIIGSYRGQITAKEFESRDKVNLLNQCDWDVSLSIEEVKSSVDYGRHACLMRATYDARLLSQINNSNSQYQCLEIKDVLQLSEAYALDSESWNSPVWPVDLGALASYEYHPLIPPVPVVSPQTGGAVGAGFDMRMNGDGSVGFGMNVLLPSTQLDGFLIKE